MTKCTTGEISNNVFLCKLALTKPFVAFLPSAQSSAPLFVSSYKDSYTILHYDYDYYYYYKYIL